MLLSVDVIDDGSSLTASEIEVGTVEAVACTDATNGTITIDGVAVLITSETELGGLTCDDRSGPTLPVRRPAPPAQALVPQSRVGLWSP